MGHHKENNLMLDEQQSYNGMAIFLHWIIAILLVGLFLLGWYMVDLPKGIQRGWFFRLHISIGLTVALLAMIRLAWRCFHKPPELPEGFSKIKQWLISVTHNLLYIAMFVQPISGYLSSSFSGYKTKIWGVPLPYWGWKSPELNEFFNAVHTISSVVLLSLIVLHLCGVVVHIYQGEMSVLRRMMPTRK